MKNKFIAALAVLAVLVLIGLFGFKPAAKNIVIRELEEFTARVEARGDGSSFLYDDVKINGNKAAITNLIYVDGKGRSTTTVALLTGRAGRNGVEAIQAINVRIDTKTQALIDVLDIQGITGSMGQIEDVAFNLLSAQNVTVEGQIALGLDAKMKISNFEAHDYARQNLGKLSVDGIALSNPLGTINMKGFELIDLPLADIKDGLDALKNGRLPLAFLPEEQVSELNGLTGGRQAGSSGNSIDAAPLFDFFLKNAPQELKDFAGNVDGNQLQQQLEEFQELDSNEQATTALQLMIDLIEANKEK